MKVLKLRADWSLPNLLKFEVPWTWERESRGQQPKFSKRGLEKVSRGWAPKVGKKVSKKARKVTKNNFADFFLTSRTFVETFFGLLGPGTFSRHCFGDFWAFGPGTPSPRSTEPQTKLTNCHWACPSAWSYVFFLPPFQKDFFSGSFARGRCRRGRSAIPHFCSKLQLLALVL